MSSTPDVPRRRFAIGLAAILLLFAFLRAPLVNVPMERDEGENAMFGLEMLRGNPPYSNAYMMKLPGGAVVDALLFAAFGPSTRTLHVALLVTNLLCIAMVAWLGRRLVSHGAGLFAAAAYGTFTIGMGMFGPWLSSEHFAVLFLLAGACLTTRCLPLEICRASGPACHPAGERADQGSGASRAACPTTQNAERSPTASPPTNHRRIVFLVGMALLGAAMVVKQHAVLPALAWAGGIAFLMLKPQPWSVRAKWIAVMGLAFFTPLILTGIAMAACGVLGSCFFWTFTYASKYVTGVPLALGWEYFKIGAGKVVADAPLLWAMAVAGAVCLMRKPPSPTARWLILPAALGGAAAAGAGLMFRGQYFILLAPFAALLAGVAWHSLTEFMRARSADASRPSHSTRDDSALIRGAVVVLSFCVLISPLRAGWTRKPDTICRTVYGMNPFPEYPAIAEYVRTHSEPGDTLAVLGSEPGIYFLADRRPASPHVCVYEMHKPHAYAREMQTEAIRTIEKAMPPCVVLINAPTSWGIMPQSDPTFYKWSGEFLKRHYTLDGVMDLISEDEVVTKWGDDARSYKRQSPYSVLIFKRLGEGRKAP